MRRPQSLLLGPQCDLSTDSARGRVKGLFETMRHGFANFRSRPLILSALAITVCTVFATEAFLRMMYWEQLKTRSYPLIYQLDPEVGYRYIPGIEGKICIPSICKTFSINKNGFYGPDFELEKAEENSTKAKHLMETARKRGLPWYYKASFEE